MMLRTLVALLHVAPLLAAPLAVSEGDGSVVQRWRAVPLFGVSPAANASHGSFVITTKDGQVLRTELSLSAEQPPTDLQLFPAPEGEGRYTVLAVGGDQPSSFLLVDMQDEATWEQLAVPLLARNADHVHSPGLRSGTYDMLPPSASTPLAPLSAPPPLPSPPLPSSPPPPLPSPPVPSPPLPSPPSVSTQPLAHCLW
jgi:hypothetical protein